MIARTHDAAAITALLAVCMLFPPASLSLSTILVALFANLIGGITPDIDQPTAPLWRNLPVGKYFGKVFGILSGGHRFLTHSILGVVLFGYVSYKLLVFLRPIMGSIDIDIVWMAYMIGMVSHLVLDTFTKEGVPWLLPVPVKFGIPPLRKWRMTTGSWLETWIVFPTLLVGCWWLLYIQYPTLLELFHAIRN